MNNILLASQIVRPVPSAVVLSSGASSHIAEGFDYTLPTDVSIDVVVTATKEYINSATSSKDDEIELAKYMLYSMSEQLCCIRLSLFSMKGCVHL